MTLLALVEKQDLPAESKALKGRTLRSVFVGVLAVGTWVIAGEVLAGPMSAPTSLVELVISRIPSEVKDLAPSLNAQVTFLALSLALVLGGCVGLIVAGSVRVAIFALCALSAIGVFVQSDGSAPPFEVGPSTQVSVLSTAAGVLVLFFGQRWLVPSPVQGPIVAGGLVQGTLATLKVADDDTEFFPIPAEAKAEMDRFNWSRGYHSGYDPGLREGHQEGMSAGYDAALSAEAARGQATRRQPSQFWVGYREGKHAFGYEVGLAMGYREAHSGGRFEEARQNGYRKGYAKVRYLLGEAMGLTEGGEAGYNTGERDGYAKGHPDGHEKGSREGFSKGWDAGYRSGHDAGHRKGYDERYGEGHEVGYNRGLPAGQDDGRRDGYEEGHQRGYNVGYNENYDQWHSEAKQRGYSEGFSQGLYKGQTERQSAT